MLSNRTSDWLDRAASEITRGEGKEVLDRVIEEGRSKAFQKRVKNTINMIYNRAIEEKMIKGVHQSPVFGKAFTKSIKELGPACIEGHSKNCRPSKKLLNKIYKNLSK